MPLDPNALATAPQFDRDMLDCELSNGLVGDWLANCQTDCQTDWLATGWRTVKRTDKRTGTARP
eukprot:4699216-Prymnesium_polylepis.1